MTILVRDNTDTTSVTHLLLDRALHKANQDNTVVVSRVTLYENMFVKNYFDSKRLFDIDMPFLYLLPGNMTEPGYVMKNLKESITSDDILNFIHKKDP